MPTPAACLSPTPASPACPAARALREDRTLIAAADYIATALGQRFVESVPLSMERVWVESRPKTPLICLLSPGVRGWWGREEGWRRSGQTAWSPPQRPRTHQPTPLQPLLPTCLLPQAPTPPS